jgi:hypothetical protein
MSDIFFFESILSYSIKKAFQSMYQIESVYQIEEKGMKTRNHGFSRLLIQVNKRYKKGFFNIDTFLMTIL